MNLEDVLNSVNKLSPSTRTLPKLQALIRDVNTGIDEIVELIKIDAGLTAQILRLSNSAYYAPATPHTGLDEAINCLGLRELYRLVGVVSTKDVFNSEMPLYNLKEGELWRISIIAALTMEALSNLTKYPTDTAYTTGLLHSIGKVAINKYSLDRGFEFYSFNEIGIELSAREKSIFGYNQAEVGAILLQKWNFPEEIFKAVQHQLEPWDHPEENNQLVYLLFLTNWVLINLEKDPQDFRLNYEETDALEAVTITESDLFECVEKVKQGLENINQLIGK